MTFEYLSGLHFTTDIIIIASIIIIILLSHCQMIKDDFLLFRIDVSPMEEDDAEEEEDEQSLYYPEQFDFEREHHEQVMITI